MKMKTYSTIDEYIRQFPEDVRAKLEKLREVIREEAPEAEEKISYQMPTFYLLGNLVHFAAFRNHIGFYPAPSGIEAYQEELSRFKTSKGAIQFPLEGEVPYDLVREIVRFRVTENLKKGWKKKALRVGVLVAAPMDRVWDCYTLPEHVVGWNSASDDWHSPRAENDLRPGGRFVYRMEARDGSMGFDFSGRYLRVQPGALIVTLLDDGRMVETSFSQEEEGVSVTTLFEPEGENTLELQQLGWQSILDHFRRYVEEGK